MENKSFFQIYIDTITKNYTNSTGRARRREYWGYSLISFPISLVFLLAGEAVKFPYLNTIYGLAVFLPGICLAVRRMHDVGKSGWFMLIPFYNFILLVTDGDTGTNEYGADPKGGSEDEIDQIGEAV